MESEKALQHIFRYQENEVRTILKDGDPWWVANDVCKVLEIVNVSQAINGNEKAGDPGLDDDEKLISGIYISGQTRQMLLINESGLYSLIFKSRKPEAKAFKRWVTNEVLPSIRKTGSYALHQQADQTPHSAIEQPEVNRLWEERLKLFNRENKIPDGYWCIFGFVAGYCFTESFRDVHLVESALPDGSVGKLWCNHLREQNFDMSLVQKYPHRYPDKRGMQWANIYPNAWLGDFWDWFHSFYLKEHYPKYLRSHRLLLPSPEAQTFLSIESESGGPEQEAS